MADHVQGSRLQRMARLAGVAARTSRDLVAARVRQSLQGNGEAELVANLTPTAERLVEVLGEMKGAATKLGQFLSLVDQDTFPAEARKALSKLLNQAPGTMDWPAVRQVVQQELGAPPEERFATFDPVPLASASMGQVHAATTFEGREVVVKVQFPGVDKAIEADLRNAGVLSSALSMAGGMLDTRKYYDELATVLRRELDYRQEAQQLRIYRDALRPWPDLVVPDILDELSARRVLTLERLHGPTMLQFAQDETAPAEDRFRVGSQLVAATWGPFLSKGVIHADPHPGNYIVMSEGRLGVLDFGATKHLSVPFTLSYWRLLDDSFHNRQSDLTGLLESAGFEMVGDRARIDKYLLGISAIVERPFTADFYDWGACRIALDVRSHVTHDALVSLRCRAPEEGLMFYRSAAGSAGVLKMLRSAGDFRKVLKDITAMARKHTDPDIEQALVAHGL